MKGVILDLLSNSSLSKIIPTYYAEIVKTQVWLVDWLVGRLFVCLFFCLFVRFFFLVSRVI
jgi:hypothetical protein